MNRNFKESITVLICILIPVIIGSLSGLGNVGSLNEWYGQLNKPAFNPPGSLFGPVWTVLYILMGISLYLVWRTPVGIQRSYALLIFAVQMTLNFAWTFIFFYFRQPGWALLEIAVLWVLILVMIIVYYRISKMAALLQIPYLLWVSFATVLNASIWMLNKSIN